MDKTINSKVAIILEQAKWVKTVKVSARVAKPFWDQTVGCWQRHSESSAAKRSLSTGSPVGLLRVVSLVGLMYSQATVTHTDTV